MQVGAPGALYWQPKDRETALFLGDATMLEAQLGEGFVDCALGRIPAATGARRGSGEIMLRPEQISLSPAAAGGQEAGACHGEVEEVEFGGALCAITVGVAFGEVRTRILVRSPGRDLPATGSRVRLEVQGGAHILER